MAKQDADDGPIDLELVRQLADIVTDNDLSEIEIEVGGRKIRIARGVTYAEAQAMPAFQPAPAPAMIAAPQGGAPAAASAPAAQASGEVIKSPMVGTVYLQPSPGAEAFVQPGAQVSAGQTLMIIEAMKTMNPVPAPRAGKVLEVLVDDGQPVEFGEPLVVLE